MIHNTTFVGIDVSKGRLDVHLHPLGQSWSTPNTQEGTKALVERLLEHGSCAIGVEASGGYERLLADALHGAGIAVYILAPSRVRSFAHSLGQLAKTDSIDARMIARYLATAHEQLVPHAPDPDRQELSALVAHRRRLLSEQSGLIGQGEIISTPLVQTLIKERLQAIKSDIARLERAITALIEQTPALKQRQDRLCQMKGVGPVLARTLLADMPELGQLSAKAAAALIGVAPHARQSGQTTRAGRCSGGRKHLRDIAFMATLSAIKAKDDVLAPFYKRLREKGKPFKLAMVACIRKLITILNAIAKTDPAFQS
jgi:transposase